jgi:Golgi phosphoprotein 3 (GPP34)
VISEALLLLLLEEEKGASVRVGHAHDQGLAGAILLDLVAAGAVEARSGSLLGAVGAAAASPASLSAAFEVLSAEPRDARKAIAEIVKALKPIKATVAAPLVAAGVLDEQRHKRLGLFETTRFPEVDPGPELALRSDLRSVLLSGAEPSPFIASLLGLLVPMDLVSRVVERDERQAAGAVAKDVAERGAVGDAVKAAVQQQVNAAVIAATVAATTAATSGSS